MRLAFLALLFLPLFAAAAPTPDRPTLAAPVMLGRENLGDVWIYLHADPGGIRLDSASLRAALAKALAPDAQRIFDAAVGTDLTVNMLRLGDIGIHLTFDEKAVTLPLRLDDQIRSRTELRVRRDFTEERDTLGPADFSGYVNAAGAQSFAYPESKARQPVQGNFGLVSNYRGFVLESGYTFTEKDAYAWKRQDTRLVKDFEASLLRVTVGELPILGSGYQNSRALGGVSVTRQYSIQPYLNIRPLNRTEIQVKRPSTIEVYVNDGFVNRMNVEAGPVQLADFPLFSGVNKVDLKVTDDLGAVEWVNLNLLFDSQLLGRGIQQFAYHAGAPAENFRTDRRYDDQNLTTSFFHRVGMTDHFTLGASFQSDKFLWLAGQDFVFLTRGGLFSGETALSHRSGGPNAGAGRVRYRSLDYKLGEDRTLRGAFEVEYKAPYFAALGQAGAVNDFSWKYDLSLSRPLTAVTSLGLGLQYQKNRFGGDDRRSARVDFSTELESQWRTSFNYTIEKENRVGHRAQVVLTWLQAEGKYYGNLSYDYPTKTTRLEATRSPSSFVGDVRATLGAQNAPERAQADGLLEYTHEKANLRVEQLSVHRRDSTGYRSNNHVSTLSVGTAVAWAGGAVGWTRPITDSFALLKAREIYRAYPVPVNRVGDFAEATVNRYGPAVVPTLTSYNETPILLDSGELPVGYSLGKDYLVARPTYRSGLRIDLGGDSAVMVAGRLLMPNGEPLALAIGKVGKSTFFTNEQGVFFLEGLSPGEYRLELDEGEYRPAVFRVENGQIGLIRLPPLKLEKQ